MKLLSLSQKRCDTLVRQSAERMADRGREGDHYPVPIPLSLLLPNNLPILRLQIAVTIQHRTPGSFSFALPYLSRSADPI